MFEAIARGDIKALWVMGTNPAVSLPDADRVRTGLGGSVVHRLRECRLERYAAARARAAAGGGVGREGRHRHQFRAPHLAPARSAAAGRRAAGLGDPRRCRAPARLAQAFAYASPADIFREHARLSGFENGGARVFDISALAEVTDAE